MAAVKSYLVHPAVHEMEGSLAFEKAKRKLIAFRLELADLSYWEVFRRSEELKTRFDILIEELRMTDPRRLK